MGGGTLIERLWDYLSQPFKKVITSAGSSASTLITKQRKKTRVTVKINGKVVSNRLLYQDGSLVDKIIDQLNEGANKFANDIDIKAENLDKFVDKLDKKFFGDDSTDSRGPG